MAGKFCSWANENGMKMEVKLAFFTSLISDNFQSKSISKLKTARWKKQSWKHELTKSIRIHRTFVLVFILWYSLLLIISTVLRNGFSWQGMNVAHLLAGNILVGATENWNVLAHWKTGFHFSTVVHLKESFSSKTVQFNFYLSVNNNCLPAKTANEISNFRDWNQTEWSCSYHEETQTPEQQLP